MPTRAIPSTTGALARLADALAARLSGRYVERVWHLEGGALLLKDSGPGGERLLIAPQRALPRLSLTREWPPTPAAPDRTALLFRKALEGARVRAVEPWMDRGMTITLTRGPDALTLAVQLAGRFPNAAVLLGPDDTPTALLHEGRPARDPDARPFAPGPDPWPELADDVWLDRWDATLRGAAERARLERRGNELARHVRAFGKRLDRKRQAFEHELARAESADRHRHHGELLKAALRDIPKGADRVRLRDWAREDGGETEVPLDPRLSPVENMQRHFHLYRKLSGGRERAEGFVLEVLETQAAVEALRGDVDAFDPDAALDDVPAADAALEALERRLRALGWRPPVQAPPRGRADDAPALPYREFRAVDGTPILVGRGARDNDRLTFQVARGQDVWLHARDCPGSHVVLRRAGRGDPSPEALLDAALLAAWHSKLRGETVIDVMWTERKHVRKPRGAGPGLVTVADTRNIAVRADPERLQRLYASLDDAREPATGDRITARTP